MPKRRAILTAAALAGAVVGARVAAHVAAEGVRRRSDPELDPLYELPPDVDHHSVPAADGGSIHVIERGIGRPLVLVHGVTLQASVWAPQLHQLADRFRVLAIDVRGHGTSLPGSDGFGRRAAARDVVNVLEHFDVRGGVLMGQSMGGMILMDLAGAFPEVLHERVAGLVFMDTAGYGLVPAPVLPLARAVGAWANRRLEEGRPPPQRKVGDDDMSWLMARLAFGERPSARAVDQVRRFLEEAPQATTLPSGVDLLDHDARSSLSTTNTPSLVLVGSRDLLTPVFAARRIARLLPNSRLEVVPGAGHQLMQERPNEVAALLDAFVKELP